MNLFNQETENLNDLMEEVFGHRPIYIGMPNPEAYAWIMRLHRHWIDKARFVALAAETTPALRFREQTVNGTPQKILEQHIMGKWRPVPTEIG